MMKGTALGAENREMNFMNKAHEKFYYDKSFSRSGMVNFVCIVHSSFQRYRYINHDIGAE